MSTFDPLAPIYVPPVVPLSAIDRAPQPVNPAQDPGVAGSTPTAVPVSARKTTPPPVVPGVATGTSVTSTNSVPLLDITTNAANVTPASTSTGNTIIPAVTRPAGNTGAIQFNNNGTFGGANSLFYNTTTGTLNVKASVYNNGFGGLTATAPVLFYDSNGSQSGMVNWVSPVSGSSVGGTGVHISPWPNYNGSPTSVRNDAGISVWRGPSGLFYRTVTNINDSQSGPGAHGLNLFDGSMYVNSYDRGSGSTVGVSQIILNAPYSSGRSIGQISSFAYTSPDQGRMWTLGWRQGSATSPNRAQEETPGNINISWNSNNRVGINGATLTQSFNVLGNIRIQATGANSNTGILFADGTFQYTAANGGGGSSSIAIQEEGSNVVATANTINFVGAGVTASNVGGVATITVSGGSGIAVQEEASNVVTSATTLNFVGSGVTASNVAGVATITVSGGSGITVQEESSNVVATANTVNFVGAGVTASNVGGVATITIAGGGSGITVQEESSTVVATATTVNFLGAGVTASNVGGVAVVTVPGGVNTTYSGSPVTTPAETINFVGPLANVTNVGFGTNTTDVTIGLTVQDESTVVTGNAAIGTLNFLGAGVTVTAGPTGVANITIPSGGGTPGSPNASIQFNDSGSFAGNTYFTFNKTNGNVDMGLGNLTVSNGNITGYTNGIPLGYKYLPGNSVTGNRDISSSDIGGYIVKWGNSDITLTTPGFPGDTNLPVGTKIEIFNANPTGNANIVAGSGGGTSTVLVGPRPNAEGILTYVQVGPYEQVTLVKLGASASNVYTGNSVVWFCYGSAYPLGVAYP